MISSGKATLAELGTALGIEDVYDILEVIVVDMHNQHAAAKRLERR